MNGVNGRRSGHEMLEGGEYRLMGLLLIVGNRLCCMLVQSQAILQIVDGLRPESPLPTTWSEP